MLLKFVFILVTVLILSNALPFANAQLRLVARVNQSSFIPGDTLVVYGKALPNDAVIARLYDPAGKALRTDNLLTDTDGSFSAQLITWPKPAKNLPYGLYKVEMISSKVPSSIVTLTLSFIAEREQITQQPLLHTLSVKLDSPTQVSTGSNFRIFVQVTFDGALVNANDPAELLGSSHIHSGNLTINLSDKFRKLHEGIYYADVKLDQDATYIIHSIAFYNGLLAHDSKVITASASSIGTIQDTVDRLNKKLDTTQQELNHTNLALNGTRTVLKEDIDTVQNAVNTLQQASGQINSLILPILALISVIIALQISLFARIRASFK